MKRQMELGDKIVWALRTQDGSYRGKSEYTIVKNMASAHTWPGKKWAENRAQPGDTVVPFVLVEIDPDSIPARAPKPVRSSADLSRLLESKI